MLLLALEGIPRGGVVTVTAEAGGFKVIAKGERAKIKDVMATAVDGSAELATLDARLVQPYYARILAEAAGLELSMKMDGDDTVVVAAVPKV